MKQSQNSVIFKNLLRRWRNFSKEYKTENIKYLMTYSFLYKYLSDNLKEFLLSLMPPEGGFEYFYEDDDYYEMFKNESLENLGYFFINYDTFFEKVIDDEYYFDYFGDNIFSKLQENIIFTQNSKAKEYFETIFSILNQYVDDSDVNSNIASFLREYVIFVSKLNIHDADFTFEQVYDLLASSRMVNVSSTPDYLTTILNKVISANVLEACDVYDPFLRDSSALISLSKEIDIKNIYGKDKSKLNYFYSLIKAIINGYWPDNISFYNHSAIQAVSIEDKTFDVIVSNIPSKFSSKYYRQSLESQKVADEKAELKEDLLLKFEESGLQEDENVMDALKTLIKEVESSKSIKETSFEGEYESLNGSEFLFMINMLNSLKNDGIMAISIPQNFLFKKSLTLLRKFLTFENKYIDAIIAVPEELGRSVRPEVIIVFKKNKTTDDIVFIDISKEYKTTKSPNAISGLFRRNLVLNDECLNKIVDIYLKREIIIGISNVVDLNELQENDFNLSVPRYVDTFGGEFINLDDLKEEKIIIDSKINELNKKIEKLMSELNIKL